MSHRQFAVAAAIVAALAVAGSAPAGAQSYPPPQHSLTVDDDTPTPGQTITVTMSTCRTGTLALFGVDLLLVGSARAGGDGVASGPVTVPAAITPGAHTVSGWCIGTDLLPLFLRTAVTVVPAGGDPAPPAPDPGMVTPPPGDGGGSGGGGAVVDDPATGSGPAGAGRSSRPRPAPSPDALAGPALPADAAAMFEDAAAANGIPAAPTPAATSRPAASGGGGASEPADRATSQDGSDAGAMPTAARVALGLAAIGGVPVALAFSRGPRTAPRRLRVPFVGGRLA